jgi:hypothetical protein
MRCWCEGIVQWREGKAHIYRKEILEGDLLQNDFYFRLDWIVQQSKLEMLGKIIPTCYGESIDKSLGVQFISISIYSSEETFESRFISNVDVSVFKVASIWE